MELKPSAPPSSENKNFVNTTKNYWKIEIKTFPECSISHKN